MGQIPGNPAPLMAAAGTSPTPERPRRAGRYGEVLATYVRRPLFQALAAATGAWAVWYATPNPLFYNNDIEPWVRLSVEAVMMPLSFFLSVGLAAAVARHARDQIASGRALLVPNSAGPNLLAAAAALAAIAAATVAFAWAEVFYAPWSAPRSPLGVLAVALTPVSVAAWWGFVARSPWTAVLFACVLLLGLSHGVDDLVRPLVHVPGRHALLTAAQVREVERAVLEQSLARWGLLALNLMALSILGWRLARVGRESSRLRRLSGSGRTSRPLLTAEAVVPHHAVAPRRARVLHRRRASPLGPGAPWLLGAALAAVLTLLTLAHDALVGRQPGGHAEVLRALLLATAVPSVAVAGAWHARRPALAYESLFPADRAAFAREVAAAVAVDVALFWLAAAAGAVASVAITRPQWLASPLLGGGLVVTAAAQCLAVGGLLLAMHARAAAVHALTPVGVAMVGAALLSALWPGQWTPDPRAAPEHLRGVLIGCLAAAAVGATLSAVAIAEWRHADLA